LALFFQGLNMSGGGKEVLWHVATTAEGGIKLLQHQEDLAIVVAGLMPGFNVDGANLSAVLSGRKVCAGADMGVIETKARGAGSKDDAALAPRGNERSAFFRGPIHFHRQELAVPVELLRDIGIVIDIYNCRLSFLQTKQW